MRSRSDEVAQREPAAPMNAAALKAALHDGREIAILDAREEGEFGASHLFWAVPCPLSQRELRAPKLLPRKATRVVCTDGGEGHAHTLAAWLRTAGYSDVSVLEGGTPAWKAAGYVLFSGVNVPSKAFGEWAEHHYHTESLDPPELKALMESGQPFALFDSRTPEEFQRMTIPGAINVPGGELVYRIGDLVPDTGTTIVINCAGRTRSIMGAESLRRAGVPNRIVALRNGTMGWELAGMQCDRGKRDSYAPGTPATAELALTRADSFAQQAGVRILPAAQLPALLADTSRSTYCLDVRAAEEYAAGHLPGFRHAPGGQLVQATDQWIAVRHARVVLTDMGNGARARMSAAWLRLMGQWEVHVLEGVPDLPAVGAPAMPQAPTITVAELAATPDALVLDFARSIAFRDGHIPGAQWAVRTRLPPLPARPIVVTAPDPALADLAAADIPGARVLEGGNAAWVASGRALEANRLVPADQDCIDFYLRPYDRNSGIEEAMREYLSWEIDLVHEVARDGGSHFGQV
ncbi:MAG: rhodanese-like domain-containing protein [Alphaproteobacteria bacterium]|nr:rhodanese-like domain-containing protein [Alphaproteobacteria bacterium]